jgi:hypothetical protein
MPATEMAQNGHRVEQVSLAHIFRACRPPLRTGNTPGKKGTICPFAPLRRHFLVRTISGVRMLGYAIRFR